MGRIVIAAYKAKPGKLLALESLVRQHHQILMGQGLVTDRAPTLMRGADGTLVEVFEWASANAIAAAHDNPAVQKMWRDYAGVCDYVPLAQLTESQTEFAEFEPFTPAAELHPELSP